MKVLIIGGTVFLGRAIVAEALRRGHDVTTFNRGVSGVDQPGVEAVRGDREVRADLERLVDGRQWDTVIDVSGFVPTVVSESAELLSGHARHYAFISTLSAFPDWPAEPVDETGRRHPCPADAGPEAGDYGFLKAGCERAVEERFDGPSLIIEPGLIIGPYENVGRLPWWLTRMARGGQVLAPGRPVSPFQGIDARDIAVFTLDQAEKAVNDRFITTSPVGGLSFGGWLDIIAETTGSHAELVWVPDEFVLAHEVAPFTELPLWMPESGPAAHTWKASPDKAIAAGLRIRPMAETVADTWTWLRGIPEAERSFGLERLGVHHGIDPGKEASVLAAWSAR
ncbi:2'-hydroxyisoflavone reductase [Sinosporangium album]|uniref:2'-hydroxyisoflavone reductase n=1 Tax=Sinosporangium album TaxID=504805 RepID=A0A1G8BCW7_9ACTN|nr:NAD-dependent epimerase/dehydratase family protein [Sinosporangium album]SDH31028.1 2'-hydroxyisoflavone reductase [Sinosporangium album]